MRGVTGRGGRNSEARTETRGSEDSTGGWAVIPTRRTFTAWSMVEIICVEGLAYIGVRG